MSLASLQRKMARAVMTPLTAGENMRRTAPSGRPMRAVAAEFIKPNDRLTSFERLELYNRQYWWRVLASVRDDFPGLRAILGDRRFDAMCEAYLVDCPSASFSMRNLGARLENWLRKHPKWAGAKQALALDMVRLEWSDIAAFDAGGELPLRAEDVAAQDLPRLRLRLQPYIQLLDLRYPVDNLLLEVRHGADKGFASNAFRAEHQRKRAAVARLKPKRIWLAVHRVDYSLYFRRLEREEFLLLREIEGGSTVGRALATVFRKSAIPEMQQAECVQRWFHNWAVLGWFCRPKGRAN